MIEYSFKNLLIKAMFTLTVFEIMLFKCSSVLLPTQQFQGIEVLRYKHLTGSFTQLTYSCLKMDILFFLNYFQNLSIIAFGRGWRH